jgi:hypothetical protein
MELETGKRKNKKAERWVGGGSGFGQQNQAFSLRKMMVAIGWKATHDPRGAVVQLTTSHPSSANPLRVFSKAPGPNLSRISCEAQGTSVAPPGRA